MDGGRRELKLERLRLDWESRRRICAEGVA